MELQVRSDGWALLQRALAAWMLCFCVQGVMAQSAKPDLMLYPARVVIQPNQRAAQVDFVNTTQAPVTYRIHLVNRRMDEWGSFSSAETPLPGERFANAMLRYSPRQVTLAPGATQTVRLLVRKPAELEEGEYRSHLLFERLEDVAQAAPDEPRPAPPQKDLSIQLKARVHVTIPVIVRHGAGSAQVRIDSLRVQPASGDQPPALDFVLHRSGTVSTYGDLAAEWTGADGRSHPLGSAQGVAIYVPNPLRRGRLPLSVPAGLSLRGGVLTLRYTAREEDGRRLIAQAAIQLP